MRKSLFLRLFAAVGIALAPAAPALAQVSNVDPNSTGEYEPGAAQQEENAPTSDAPSSDSEYQPVDAGSQDGAAPAAEPSVQAETSAAPTAQGSNASARASVAAAEGTTIPRSDVFSAAESVFGKGTEGLADLIEDILRDQGEPSAYITGREASGAFVVGVRYGSGTLHHTVEGDRAIYWTGPSVGFDFGADASKVFVLVYNLVDSQEIFRRYPAGEGRAYVVGGFTASYLRRGDTVLIPVRLGVGLRLGVNGGYMRFSEKSRWLPF